MRVRLKQWLLGLTGVVILAIAGLVIYVSRPTVQREFALANLRPFVDSLAIEYVRVLPWSLVARGVEVTYRGARYHVGKVEIGFNPLALFEKTVSIRSLYLRHTDLDLRAAEPTPPATSPFPGVLPTLRHGYALALRNVDAVASVLLPAEHNLTVRLAGGSFKPHVPGTLNLDVDYVVPNDAGTISNRGLLTLDQLAEGRIRSLHLAIAHTFALKALRAPLTLRTEIKVAPPPGIHGNPYRVVTRTLPDGTQAIIPAPEFVSISLRHGDDAATPSAEVELNGLYRGEDGAFNAAYRVTGNQQGLAAVTDAKLPEFTTELRGGLTFETLAIAGQATFEAALRVTALDRLEPRLRTLPTPFALQGNGALAFDKARVELTTSQWRLRDGTDTERTTFKVTEPIALSFANPLALLDTPRDLAELNIGPLPLAWGNAFLGESQMSGELAGTFVLRVDDERRFKLDPAASTTLQNFAFVNKNQTEIEAASLTVSPTASWSRDFVRCGLSSLDLKLGNESLGKLDLKVAQKQTGESPRTWRYRVSGGIAVDTLKTLPRVATAVANYPLPKGLAVQFKTLLAQRESALSIEKLELQAASPTYPALLSVQGLQPFHAHMDRAKHALATPRGDVARLVLRGFDLAWLNPWLTDTVLNGTVQRADGILQIAREDRWAFTMDSPLELTGLSLRTPQGALLEGLQVSLVPSVAQTARGVNAEFKSLKITHAEGTLVHGRFALDVADLTAVTPSFKTSGEISLDGRALVAQPALVDIVPAAMRELASRADLTFDMAGSTKSIKAQRLNAEVTLGPDARATLSAEPGLVIKPELAPGELLAQHAVGAVALDIEHVSSTLLARFVPLERITFGEINSNLRLRSDGTVLRASSLAPLRIEDVQISGEKGLLLQPFDLTTTAFLRVEQRKLRGNFESTSLAFRERTNPPAVAGDLKLQLEPGLKVPLTGMTAKLAVDLPQLLAQPAVMPGHKLSAGTLALDVTVDERRNLTGNLNLNGLAATTALSVASFELPLHGTMAADGHGFDFTAPLTGTGKSGVTNATVIGHYAPQPDEPRVLELNIASDVFYLNDILASVQAIRPVGITPSTEGANKVALSELPDDHAAWKVIPYAVVIKLAIEKLFYSDYLAFTEVAGNLDLRRRKLALEGFKARFHDSALNFDGVTRFKADDAEPYDLTLSGNIRDFDLNQFFTELVPGEKSRVEGLFGVDFKAFGKFPNFTQARNKVLFDVKMHSREGLFRTLPPDSGLLLGASDVLGLVGEGLSYVPTGGFGAGAVARLVNYIAEIDYDTIDIHLRRDESRNVDIAQFLVLSPTIALTATGGVKYTAGKDILDSPLELNANLDMLGRGAAILYSMDLMQDAQNEFGYWRGPEIKISGTPNEPVSNFESIIGQAEDGTLKGAIVRPISGLIGNLKYRWFNDDSKAQAAAKAARDKNTQSVE